MTTKKRQGTHPSKPPKSPKAKYNQMLEAQRAEKKAKPQLPHQSVKEAFK
jgi:hypothetical protein